MTLQRKVKARQSLKKNERIEYIYINMLAMLAMTTCDESKLKYSSTLRIFQQFNFCTYKKQLIDIIYLSPFLVTLETFNLMELS